MPNRCETPNMFESPNLFTDPNLLDTGDTLYTVDMDSIKVDSTTVSVDKTIV